MSCERHLASLRSSRRLPGPDRSTLPGRQAAPHAVAVGIGESEGEALLTGETERTDGFRRQVGARRDGGREEIHLRMLATGGVPVPCRGAEKVEQLLIVGLVDDGESLREFAHLSEVSTPR